MNCYFLETQSSQSQNLLPPKHLWHIERNWSTTQVHYNTGNTLVKHKFFPNKINISTLIFSMTMQERFRSELAIKKFVLISVFA